MHSELVPYTCSIASSESILKVIDQLQREGYRRVARLVMHTEEGKLHAHPPPSVLHDTRICEGSPVRARWTCKTIKTLLWACQQSKGQLHGNLLPSGTGALRLLPLS